MAAWCPSSGTGVGTFGRRATSPPPSPSRRGSRPAPTPACCGARAAAAERRGRCRRPPGPPLLPHCLRRRSCCRSRRRAPTPWARRARPRRRPITTSSPVPLMKVRSADPSASSLVAPASRGRRVSTSPVASARTSQVASFPSATATARPSLRKPTSWMTSARSRDSGLGASELPGARVSGLWVPPQRLLGYRCELGRSLWAARADGHEWRSDDRA